MQLGVIMSFKWAVRIFSLIFGLSCIVAHQAGYPVLNWLWDLWLVKVNPALIVLAFIFVMFWLPRGGK